MLKGSSHGIPHSNHYRCPPPAAEKLNRQIQDALIAADPDSPAYKGKIKAGSGDDHNRLPRQHISLTIIQQDRIGDRLRHRDMSADGDVEVNGDRGGRSHLPTPGHNAAGIAGLAVPKKDENLPCREKEKP